MTTINTYNFRAEGLQQLLNDERVIFIDSLVRRKEITAEAGHRLKVRSLLLVTERGVLGKLWEKLINRKATDDAFKITLVWLDKDQDTEEVVAPVDSQPGAAS